MCRLYRKCMFYRQDQVRNITHIFSVVQEKGNECQSAKCKDRKEQDIILR